MEIDVRQRRNQRNRRRERAQRMQAERDRDNVDGGGSGGSLITNSSSSTGSTGAGAGNGNQQTQNAPATVTTANTANHEPDDSADEDMANAPPVREKPPPRRKKQKELSPLLEEDIIDGFAILAFKTYEDLEVSIVSLLFYRFRISTIITKCLLVAHYLISSNNNRHGPEMGNTHMFIDTPYRLPIKQLKSNQIHY